MSATRTILRAIVTLAWLGAYAHGEDKMHNPEDGTNKVVSYEDFGAHGNGKTDDSAAIAKAHAFANQHGLPVKADDNATYYIGGTDSTAIIQTDTDFGTARFMIDDTDTENHRAHLFIVQSTRHPIPLEGIASLKSGQRTIAATLPQSCFVTVKDDRTTRYIRRGKNQNNGSPQRDVFLVDKDGHVDAQTPILWDFSNVAEIVAYPIDPERLTISGGIFTSMANAAPSDYHYYSRGISIKRSNVLVTNLQHRITDEGDHGAPYHGFISISHCANVTVADTTLTGHKTYRTIGSAGKPASMGSYDINVNGAINIAFVNCRQTNDINDITRWGIMGSNRSKNLLYDGCTLSRFDAHQGVAGATIRNSTLGHGGIRVIGHGTLLVENTTVYARSFITLRPDYGSTWRGEFIIRNGTFIPAGGRSIRASVIDGANDGQHDFGYTCTMPKRITIDGLHIDDSHHPKRYQGPALFANFNPLRKDDTYKETYPYSATQEVILKNVTVASGKPLRTSRNPVMFKDVQVKEQHRDHQPAACSYRTKEMT